MTPEELYCHQSIPLSLSVLNPPTEHHNPPIFILLPDSHNNSPIPHFPEFPYSRPHFPTYKGVPNIAYYETRPYRTVVDYGTVRIRNVPYRTVLYDEVQYCTVPVLAIYRMVRKEGDDARGRINPYDYHVQYSVQIR
jgi:hypothetical protein